MKKKLILILALVALIIASTLTIILINNQTTPPEEKTILEKIFTPNENIQESTNETTQESSTQTSSTSSGGGGGGSSSSSSETSSQTELICKLQEIQYSLKNFEEEITCLENSTGICTTLHAICSVQIYNLDANSTEDFEIKYSIINSDKESLNSTNTKINVKLEYPETIETEFLIQDISGLDQNSECRIQMITIPRKEICY